MTHKPDENTVLSRRREVAWRPFDGEAILVDTAHDEICHLNPVAAYLWEALDGRLDLRGIAERLAEEFEVEQAEAPLRRAYFRGRVAGAKEWWRSSVKRVFEIAGITFELAPDREDLEMLLPPSFGAFSSSGAPEFRIYLEESEEMRADPLPFFLPYRFELGEDGEGYSFLNPREDGVKRLGTICSHDNEDRLLFPPDGHDWSDPDIRSAVSLALSDFIKTCLQVRLLRQDGTMLHASGIERKGSGYVFLGPSGAGKSTAAGLLGARPGRSIERRHRRGEIQRSEHNPPCYALDRHQQGSCRPRRRPPGRYLRPQAGRRFQAREIAGPQGAG